MGRVSNKTAYTDLVPADELQQKVSLSNSGTPALRPSEGPETSPYMGGSPGGVYMPQTPSPFCAPQPDPSFMNYPMTMLDQDQMGGGAAMPTAFGDFGSEDTGAAMTFNYGETQSPYMFQYDPNTGGYMAYMPYDVNACYNMPYDMNAGYALVTPDHIQMQEESQNPSEQTQVLLSALSEKITEDQIQLAGEAPLEVINAMPVNGEELADPGNMETWNDGTQRVENWDDAHWEQNGNGNGNGWEDQQQPNRRRTERREARDAARRQDRATNAAEGGGGAWREDRTAKSASEWAPQSQKQAAPGGITTVMFRNIPNKYTREMLVNQLEQDMRGQFDFIYLPIDFKNKCNVGYAFINFRTVEACDTFVNRFNGVEVWKCLPGLNSRKVTEVTPARVQGFEENVQRLRNSPVMRELVHKPEWLPVIFDYNGLQVPFPSPERALEPIKPRRRTRDEEARLL